MSDAAASSLVLRDVSARARFGCKGPGAERFLASIGLPLPASPNGWAVDDAGRLVGRLATAEFLVEAVSGSDSARMAGVAEELLDPERRQSGLVPVQRQDRVIELSGPRAGELLRQTCNVNFDPLARAANGMAGQLVMTSMVGVGVIVIPREAAPDILYTIWADPSFGDYLWKTLADVATDLGGDVRRPAAAWGETAN